MPDPDVLALAAGPPSSNPSTLTANRPAGRVPVVVKRLLCGGIVALALPILALTPRTGGAATPAPIAAVTPVTEVAAAPSPASTSSTTGSTAPTSTSAAPATTTWTAPPTTRPTTPPTDRPATTAKPVTTTTWTAPPTTRSNPQVIAATFLQCVRSRESGGNYQAVNPSSGTAGAYQFHQATWDQTAGSIGRADLVGTRPDQAAPATQDLVAVSLYQSAGAGPWGGGCIPPTDR